MALKAVHTTVRVMVQDKLEDLVRKHRLVIKPSPKAGAPGGSAPTSINILYTDENLKSQLMQIFAAYNPTYFHQAESISHGVHVIGCNPGVPIQELNLDIEITYLGTDIRG